MSGSTIPLLVAALAVGASAVTIGASYAAKDDKDERKVEVRIPKGVEKPSVGREKVRAVRGAAVEWTYKNESNKPVRLKVGNFRPEARYASEDECRDKVPVEGGCLKDVLVGNGRNVTVQCRVKKTAHYPRTYKYDIIGDGKVVLDPVLEIPPG